MPATGPRTPPTPGRRPANTVAERAALSVVDVVTAEGESGQLEVQVTIANRTGVELTRTLKLYVVVSDETHEFTREVAVPGNEEQEFTITISEISYAAFASDGSLRTEIIWE